MQWGDMFLKPRGHTSLSHKTEPGWLGKNTSWPLPLLRATEWQRRLFWGRWGCRAPSSSKCLFIVGLARSSFHPTSRGTPEDEVSIYIYTQIKKRNIYMYIIIYIYIFIQVLICKGISWTCFRDNTYTYIRLWIGSRVLLQTDQNWLASSLLSKVLFYRMLRVSKSPTMKRLMQDCCAQRTHTCQSVNMRTGWLHVVKAT